MQVYRKINNGRCIMSPSWLSAIGRAAPAITRTMQELQERPKQEARWGWEQEQAGQRKEAFGQQKAINEITINKMKAEEETRKEQERIDKAPISLRTHPFMANFLPEDLDKIIEMGRKIGLVTGEKGSEETTGRGWKYFQQMVGENEQMATWVANAEGRKIQKLANDAFTKYEKVSNDPSATPEDKAKAFKILETANASKAGHLKNFDAYISAIKFANDFKALQKNPAFVGLPPNKQYQIIKAAEDAMATQDYDQYYKARDKAFEEAKQTFLYPTREQAVAAAPPVKGYTTSAELLEKGWKPHYLLEQEKKGPEKLTMADIKSAYSMDIGNIKNQMMIEMTPDEQINLAGQPDVNILALLLSGRVGKSLSPEKKKYYTEKLQEAEKFYGDLTNQVLGRKGAKIPDSKPPTPTEKPLEAPRPMQKETPGGERDKAIKILKEKGFEPTEGNINEIVKQLEEPSKPKVIKPDVERRYNIKKGKWERREGDKWIEEE